MRRGPIWLTVALMLAVATSAHAHRLSPAYLGLTEVAEGRYAVQWKVSISGGLVEALEPQIPLGCAIAGSVRTYVIEDARVQLAEFECDGGMRGRELAVNGLEITDTDVLVRVDYLDGSSFTHRLVPESTSATVPERPGNLEVSGTYLVLGVEHILLGIDHLLFVLALLLIVRGVGRLVATITAFTVAHSFTLAAATLGIVNVPSAPVEATIALSILFLATELARRESFSSVGAASRPRFIFPRLRRDRGREAAPTGARADDRAGADGRAGADDRADGRAGADDRAGAHDRAEADGRAGAGARAHAAPAADASLTKRFPWIVAFSFGLLHGFGFAGALSEVGLPEQAIPIALLFFNIGVELGQLVFVAAVLGVGWLMAKAAVAVPRFAPRLTAYVVGSVAAYWVFERTITAI